MEKESTEVEIDAALLEKVGRGDRASFGQLYDRMSGLLFSMAYRVLNDREAAEDVLQDVFIQIWDKASTYDVSRGKPLTWAVTLTRNKAIDRLRAARRRYQLREELEREAVLDWKAAGKSSSDELVDSEKSRMVRQAVARLPLDQRRAIDLAFFGGMTQSEIADELGEPLGTIKARIRRGMMKLREILAPVL
jgi:RNA polymerase sigma-70 factor (ECF subfamily)